MTHNKADDIRWVAGEVADLAILLHSHGLDYLAAELDMVQRALQSMHNASRLKRRTFESGETSGKVVLLERFLT